MAFETNLQPGEQLFIQKEFRGSNHHVFAMAVSNQALYLSAQRWALKDDWYFKRVPLGEVEAVCLKKQKPLFPLLVSVAMIAIGGFVSVVMLMNTYNPTPHQPAYGSGWPIAIFVGGLVIPFIARGRRILVVRMKKGRFKWKPQLAVDQKTRQLYADIQNELLVACRNVGLRTTEE
jgi:hypothetical protein